MATEVITSRTNALMTQIRKLVSSASCRREQGLFVGDGGKLLEEALRWNATVTTVVATEGVSLPPLPGSVRRVCVPPELLKTIAPSETPQGILFLCAVAPSELPQALNGKHYIVLEEVQDPGNVGTILRTADAFDADGLFLVGACADLYNPKTIRATMGALFRRPVWRCDVAQMKALLAAAQIPLYGAALRQDTVDARTVDYTRAAVAIGSEGHGLSAELLALCERTIRLPMSERCESLNAAAAASVLLWEMYR